MNLAAMSHNHQSIAIPEKSRDVGGGVSWQSTQICPQEKNKSFHHKIGVVCIYWKNTSN